jgi:AcrR family transcriptional regulator
MGHRHSRDEILDGALATAYADGLSGLSFGRVAKRLGTSDRMVVYYFPNKADLISNVLMSVGIELQLRLADAVTEPHPDHLSLVRAAWPVLASDECDPAFGLFFEANGMAAAGVEPYRELVPMLVTAWSAWLSDYLDVDEADRGAEAEAVIALVDGLLLIRQLVGPDAAERAASRMGVT